MRRLDGDLQVEEICCGITSYASHDPGRDVVIWFCACGILDRFRVVSYARLRLYGKVKR